MQKTAIKWAVYTLPFVFFFVMIPLKQLGYMANVPGDVGDGRLNAYFLEHIWQVVIGRADSFVHLPIFAPNLWVVAFSDNHWGTGFIYVIMRALGFDSVGSFQLWWLTAYACNFIAALAAFRILRLSPIAATVGALVFTFALPVTAHSFGHAQLSYRFGAPLALALYMMFLLEGGARRFLLAVFFTVWQTYATIYIGFFTLIALLFTTLAHFRFFFASRTQLKEWAQPALSSLKGTSAQSKILFWLLLALMLALFVAAFVPYLIPADVYGSSRSRHEIGTMLPRLHSYFFTQVSSVWKISSPLFLALPVKHEHQMFIGLSAMIMAFAGAWLARAHERADIARLFWVALAGMILITLNSSGVSLWFLIVDLPLVSAIRAMTRIDLVMLFFASGMIAVFVDRALQKGVWMRLILCVGLALTAYETTKVHTLVTGADPVRATVIEDLASVDGPVDEDALLFVAQEPSEFWVHGQVRAMWLALELGLPSINGYSGKSPKTYDDNYGISCAEAGNRLALAYQNWPSLEEELGPLSDTVQRVKLVGFGPDCTLDDVALAAQFPPRSAPLPVEIAPQTTLSLIDRTGTDFVIEIANNSPFALVPKSQRLDSVNLAWSWVGQDGEARDYQRQTFKQVIPAGERMQVLLPIPEPGFGDLKGLRVSLVQEGHFWFHDVGMQPLDIPLR